MKCTHIVFAGLLALLNSFQTNTLPIQEAGNNADYKNIKLLCVVWMTGSNNELELLERHAVMLSGCTTTYYFTDTEAHEFNLPERAGSNVHLQRVDLPKQTLGRFEKHWLYHKNMVGITPSLTYLFENNIAENFDWLLSVELDMAVFPDRVRQQIQLYLDLDQLTSKDGVMLAWGNAFLLSEGYLKNMKNKWDELSKTATDPPEAAGCPEFMRKKNQWPFCAQDIIFPHLGNDKSLAKKYYGRSGCGQVYRYKSLEHLACFEMSKSPFGKHVEGYEMLMNEMEHMQEMESPEKAREHYKEENEGKYHDHWALMYAARNVPVIHHADPRLHDAVLKHFPPKLNE
eukprot:m.29312 g.29312  ORF g.29312 m.29312 type:complete len:343 (-) comp8090_c0_seq1:32-1060(-)